MDKTFGYYIFGGALIGALFGLIWATYYKSSQKQDLRKMTMPPNKTKAK